MTSAFTSTILLLLWGLVALCWTTQAQEYSGFMNTTQIGSFDSSVVTYVSLPHAVVTLASDGPSWWLDSYSNEDMSLLWHQNETFGYNPSLPPPTFTYEDTSNILYVTSNGQPMAALIAVNMTNGNVLWQLPVSSSSGAQYGPLCPNSETLFAVWTPYQFYSGTPQNITAFDARTGAQLWTTVSLGRTNELSMCSSSTIATREAPKGVVVGIFVHDSNGAVAVFGLRSDNGALLWSNETFYNNSVSGIFGAFARTGTRPIWYGVGAGTQARPMAIDGVTGVVNMLTPTTSNWPTTFSSTAGFTMNRDGSVLVFGDGQSYLWAFDMLKGTMLYHLLYLYPSYTASDPPGGIQLFTVNEDYLFYAEFISWQGPPSKAILRHLRTGELVFRSTPFSQGFETGETTNPLFLQPVGNSSGSASGQPPTKVFVTNGQSYSVFEISINVSCSSIYNEGLCATSARSGCLWCASQNRCYQPMEESCIDGGTECGNANPDLPMWPWPGSTWPLTQQCATVGKYCQGCGGSCLSVYAGNCCGGAICSANQQCCGDTCVEAGACCPGLQECGGGACCIVCCSDGAGCC